jgi:hypothetical protein
MQLVPLHRDGIVVHNGEIVPSLGLDDEIGTGTCDAVRKVGAVQLLHSLAL